jgi:hypothetical protein
MEPRIRFSKPKNNANTSFSGLTINFDNEIVIKEIPAYQVKVSKVEIKQIVDSSVKKQVIAYTNNLGIVTLWEGAAYDAIGQWTDADVDARIKELYN